MIQRGPGHIPLRFNNAMAVQVPVFAAVELDTAYDGHFRGRPRVEIACERVSIGHSQRLRRRSRRTGNLDEFASVLRDGKTYTLHR